MEKLRCFIAFDIDDELILMNLRKAQDAIQGTGADMKIIEAQNIHITLRFLGDIQANFVEEIHSIMKRINFKPFDVHIKGIGIFPSRNYIRIIWAGITEGNDGLDDIFKQVEPKLRMLGFKPDRRGFSPHITIARIRTRRQKENLLRTIDDLDTLEFGTLKASCLKLKQSTLTPRGPIYSTLKYAQV